MSPKVLIVMGVSGSGKTTLGQALAQRLGWAFADADDYHPQSNRDKMARGQPLTDADREPWLLRLRGLIEQHLAEDNPLVLACSALKESYRTTLSGGLEGVRYVFLHGDPALIAQRMQNREHYMPVSLLQSQLETLEPPTNAIQLDISRSLEDNLREVLKQLRP
ncbi:gluconokinase [Meiothermus granaticius]|uniref:Gluconokinase n=1 Tax=Meiothermus granaticius NBRC 107808 TaxID=1227551 RepID=A0A399FC37_9DEIN|nr:gluconokinase [Meiothermus granaticius]RIH92859.1 Gluconokinase [Meiothermus granaticius NBRC 107808]GEM85573.1 gluconokinase [Meiothermus granaticius NBRC 107808]